MNKKNIRAFAFGIIFSAGTLGLFYLSMEEKAFTIKEAQALLKEENYVVLSDTDYAALQADAAKKPQEPPVEQEKPSVPADEENKQSTEQGVPSAYSLTVKSGMASKQIADELEEHKIIENSDEFQHFMDTYGYSTKIQLGTFELTSKMDYRQIANTITK